MNVKTIPLSTIIINDSPYYNINRYWKTGQEKDSKVNEIADSMKTEGQLSPITVVVTEEMNHCLAAGLGRVLAAKKLGWNVIQANVMTKAEYEEAEAKLGPIRFDNKPPPTIHPQHVARVFTDIFLSLRPSHPASSESIKGIIELILSGQKIPGLNRTRVLFKFKNELVHDHGKHYFDNPSLSAKKILGSWYQGPMVVADELTRKIQASATQRYTAEQVLQIIHEIRTELTMDVSTGNYQPPEPKL